jgi:peptide/nickel transport system permease protein
MIAYIVRRILYAIPILIGVNLLTFALFFLVNTPDDMARMQLGQKRVTPEAIQKWKAERGSQAPFDAEANGTQFTDDFLQAFCGDVRVRVRQGDDGRDIASEIHPHGAGLAIALRCLPSNIANITFALLMVFFRHYLNLWGVVLCVVLMSISGLFYIIAGQYFIAKLWNLLPISGFAGGIDGLRFILLPVIVSVVAGLGSGSRWYRTIFLEEIGKDYVRTARAKGLSEIRVLFRHVLKNGMIPILTGAVVVLPLLFMGSLITESFFGIPGLGSYTIDAIQAQDFAVVRALVPRPSSHRRPHPHRHFLFVGGSAGGCNDRGCNECPTRHPVDRRADLRAAGGSAGAGVVHSTPGAPACAVADGGAAPDGNGGGTGAGRVRRHRTARFAALPRAAARQPGRPAAIFGRGTERL